MGMYKKKKTKNTIVKICLIVPQIFKRLGMRATLFAQRRMLAGRKRIRTSTARRRSAAERIGKQTTAMNRAPVFPGFGASASLACATSTATLHSIPGAEGTAKGELLKTFWFPLSNKRIKVAFFLLSLCKKSSMHDVAKVTNSGLQHLARSRPRSFC